MINENSILDTFSTKTLELTNFQISTLTDYQLMHKMSHSCNYHWDVFLITSIN